jgi:hypothetical protein
MARFPDSLKAFLVLPLLAAGALWGQGKPDALDDLNAAFRTTYAMAKARQLSGTVIVINGDRALLMRPGAKTAEAVIRPPLYHRLKAVDHVPLALYLALEPLGKGPIPQERRTHFTALQALAEAAMGDLSKSFQGPALQRQRRILDRCFLLLEEVLRTGKVNPSQLAAFAAEQAPMLMANAKDAAELQLEALHREVSRWRQALEPAEWNRLRVVLMGSHMAREGEVSWQYFSRLLGQPREGDRIVYAESRWELGEALDLLATHGVDQGLGRAFFGDPARMHRDVLADAAKAWLEARPMP